MSCKLALQIFSRTTATAIKTCVSSKLINAKNSLDTEDFLLTIGTLNSDRLFDKKPFHCGLSDKHIIKANEILKKGKGETFFSSLIKVARKYRNKNQKSLPHLIESRPQCFEGMVQTINT